MSSQTAGHSHFYPAATFTDTQPPGMPVQVKLLRDNGRKVTRSELDAATPMIGRLRIHDTWRDRGGKRHFVRMAELHALGIGSGSLPSLQKPLFEVVLVSLDSAGFILSGHEIDVIDGKAVQFVQVWLVQPEGTESLRSAAAML
jgi:hypothetical protein